MKTKEVKRIFGRHNGELSRDGNNAEFVVMSVLPFLHLSDPDKQVIRWAYGYDGEIKNYELVSDGETGVKDFFLNGAIKCPGGVTHDYINRVPAHITPDGHTWTRQQSNRLYLRVVKALGYPPLLRWRRFLFLSATWFWWQSHPCEN